MNEQPLLLTTETQQFYEEIIGGLLLKDKQLPAKYFYDAAGDDLFQQIMNSPEYYVTGCEMEIFQRQVSQLIDLIAADTEPFELIELGPGDCEKTIHLLKGLLKKGKKFSYKPIDISENIIAYLENTLPVLLPGLEISGANGEYLDMLKISPVSGLRKVVLFLGANIGNMSREDAQCFCSDLNSYLLPGDLLVTGFDLKKNPRVIRAAYDDAEGITKRFNLNLLTRINRELGANFDLENFEHYCSYDPGSGACKSYLVSLKNMIVHLRDQQINFKKDEPVWMEISQKYTVEQIHQMAHTAGFTPLEYLYDSKRWFTDTIWRTL